MSTQDLEELTDPLAALSFDNAIYKSCRWRDFSMMYNFLLHRNLQNLESPPSIVNVLQVVIEQPDHATYSVPLDATSDFE